jgi:hypothetical protein
MINQEIAIDADMEAAEINQEYNMGVMDPYVDTLAADVAVEEAQIAVDQAEVDIACDPLVDPMA